MADGVKGVASDIGEAVVKPVVDEVGKAVEQGVQSVVSGPGVTTPQQQQKQLEDAGKLSEARRKIKYWQDLETAQKAVRDKQKQEQQKVAQVSQSKQIKQFEVVNKKKENMALQQAQRKTEIKKGVGG